MSYYHKMLECVRREAFFTVSERMAVRNNFAESCPELSDEESYELFEQVCAENNFLYVNWQ